MFIRFK